MSTAEIAPAPASQTGLQSPGEITIDSLIVYSLNGKFISVLDYMVELQLYESIFSNVLSGELLLSDSANLIKALPIIGEELLILKAKTPTLPDEFGISKTFRIYCVEDRQLVRDQNTQIYKLKFISQEGIVDSISPLFNPYNGTISDIVSQIYSESLAIERTYDVSANDEIKLNSNKTDLIVLNETDNQIKFVSPGWTAFQCINWLAKKSIPKDLKACNFLFWETTKNFFFGSIENLIKRNLTIGKYRYAPSGVMDGTNEVAEKMLLIEHLDVISSLDNLNSLDNGYFSSKMIALDIYNKTHDVTYYDHSEKFKDYNHLSTDALFNNSATVSNLDRNITIYPKQSILYDGIAENYTEKMDIIHGNRNSNLMDLNNLRLNINIYGRTDVEVGRTIEIAFPNFQPASEKDLSTENLDNRFSGNYLITSINHKINPVKHTISMEIVRDSINSNSASA
jgi:hypothetical protein